MPSLETIETLLTIKAIWIVASAAIFATGTILFFRFSRRAPPADREPGNGAPR